jgi:hypothetical protein
MSTAEARKARLLAAVRAEPSPARAEVRRRDRALLVLAMPAFAGLVLLVSGVHVHARPHALVVASAVLWAAVASLATAVALYRGRTMLGAPRGWVLGGALATAPLLAAAWFCVLWPDLRAVPHPLSVDLMCFALTLALASAPLFFLLRVRREGDPVHPGITGAMTGAAAGAWGATLIDLHCELLDPTHVVLGHVLPVALLLIVGAAWGRRGLSIAASPPG